MQDELLKRTEEWLNNVKGWQLEGEKIVVALLERVQALDTLKKQLGYADLIIESLERQLCKAKTECSEAKTECKTLIERVRELEEENTRLRERTLWPPGGRTWTVIRCLELDRLQADNDNLKAQLKEWEVKFEDTIRLMRIGESNERKLSHKIDRLMQIEVLDKNKLEQVRQDTAEECAKIAESQLMPGICGRDDYWQPLVAKAIRAKFGLETT